MVQKIKILLILPLIKGADTRTSCGFNYVFLSQNRPFSERDTPTAKEGLAAAPFLYL